MINKKKKDVEELGYTLLNAFYLCEPLDPNLIAHYNS
jgi:hypothetical protein